MIISINYLHNIYDLFNKVRENCINPPEEETKTFLMNKNYDYKDCAISFNIKNINELELISLLEFGCEVCIPDNVSTITYSRRKASDNFSVYANRLVSILDEVNKSQYVDETCPGVALYPACLVTFDVVVRFTGDTIKNLVDPYDIRLLRAVYTNKYTKMKNCSADEVPEDIIDKFITSVKLKPSDLLYGDKDNGIIENFLVWRLGTNIYDCLRYKFAVKKDTKSIYIDKTDKLYEITNIISKDEVYEISSNIMEMKAIHDDKFNSNLINVKLKAPFFVYIFTRLFLNKVTITYEYPISSLIYDIVHCSIITTGNRSDNLNTLNTSNSKNVIKSRADTLYNTISYYNNSSTPFNLKNDVIMNNDMYEFEIQTTFPQLKEIQAQLSTLKYYNNNLMKEDCVSWVLFKNIYSSIFRDVSSFIIP